MHARMLAGLAVLVFAGSALAQDAATDDWEIVREPARKTVHAFVPMSTGLTIGFRCVDGVYGAVIAGLPPAPRDSQTRVLGIGMGNGPLADTTWTVTTDRSVAMADYPSRLARDLRAGGAISIVIPNGAGRGRSLRHTLALPESSTAIDETLAACDRPLDDPRDALLPAIAETGLPEGVTWLVPPRPRYPGTTYRSGQAVLTCVVQPTGRLEQCVVESEFPVDGGFGRSALRAAPDARIQSPAETPGTYSPRILGFRVNYRSN